MNKYFLFEMFYNPKNMEVESIINELIDTSIFLEVEIKFHIFKDEKYPVERIKIIPSYCSRTMMTEYEIGFHGYYLETYMNHTNIDLLCIEIMTDIN